MGNTVKPSMQRFRRNQISLIIILLLMVILFSCKVKKDSGQQEEAKSKAAMEEKYLADGFVKATVIETDKPEEMCKFLLQLEDGVLLEPLKFDSVYRVNEKVLWIKYQMHRRPSRCGNSLAIGIEEIRE